jgi:hypothetical protein
MCGSSWTLFLSIFAIWICSTIVVVGVTDELREAVHMADVNRVRFLLNLDPEVQTSRPPVIIDHPRGDSAHGRTALMMCGMDPQERGKDQVDQDCLRIAQLLEKQGANLTFVDKQGWDVLSMAAVRGFRELSSYLVSKGADPNRQDSEGRTPLMKAAFHGHLETFRMLLHEGANASTADAYRGLTATHFATMFALQNPHHAYHLKGVASALAQREFSIDCVDRDGRTCLMYAIISVDKALVRILLEAQADPRKVDRFGIPAIAMSSDEEIGLMLGEAAITFTEKEHAAWLEATKIQPEPKKPKSPQKKRVVAGDKHSDEF